MRILAFSDLHCDAAAASNLVKLASDVDLVVGAGDFGNIRSGLETTLNILRAIDKPAVLVAGNNESTDELREAARSWHSATVLHGDQIKIAGIDFFGIGGGIPTTPFGAWSYDFTEDQAKGLLSTCHTRGVLVSHSPPKGVCDRSSRGQSLGSTAVRATIERCNSRLVICGHIHGSARQVERLNATTVINAGPAGILYTLE